MVPVLVVVWDSGEFVPIDTNNPIEALASGKLSFELKGKKLKGAFALAQMKGLPKSSGKEWLLMKKKDAYAKNDFMLKTELRQHACPNLKNVCPHARPISSSNLRHFSKPSDKSYKGGSTHPFPEPTNQGLRTHKKALF